MEKTDNFIVSIDPSSEVEIAKYTLMDEKKLNEIITESNEAFNAWSSIELIDRVKFLEIFSKNLEYKKEEVSLLITTEMGKPISQSKAEVSKCVSLCNYYIENAEVILKDEIYLETSEGFYHRIFKPLGSILGIMPWNFPFWQVLRFCIPNILLGNIVLIKHASNVTGSNLLISELFQSSMKQFKAHLKSNKTKPWKKIENINNIYFPLIIKSQKTEFIIQNKVVKGVTLTGSEKAGSSVASLAGKYLKKSLLELGGSDPYLVLKDADIELAVNKTIESRLINSGQSCIGAKRIIVVSECVERFTNLLLLKLKNYACGDPKNEDTNIGPLAKKEFKDQLILQVEKSIELGAKIKLGDSYKNNKSLAIDPIVLIDVKPDMPAFDEEIFGPVFSIIKAENTEKAIELANHSSFGLGAAVFSSNIKSAKQIAKHKLNCGMCFINDYVKSDPRVPFGGVNNSGYGRELSAEGMLEFSNLKIVFTPK